MIGTFFLVIWYFQKKRLFVNRENKSGVSEWFQVYHDDDDNDVCCVLDKHA